jgi:hypothetical protein
MKLRLVIVFSLILSTQAMAREFNTYEDLAHYKNDPKVVSKEKQYEDKIAYLEAELAKYKGRLVEKSLYLEKSQEGLKTKYEQEITYLKREVIYKTKSLMEAQRQIEKMNPSEDMKSLIKVNTEMAAQIRSAQDQLAIANLKMNKPNTVNRVPASIKSK